MVEAKEYIENFSSDRSHMKLLSGDWAAPPPSWPPIVQDGISNLMEWLSFSLLVTELGGPSKMLTLEQVIELCSSSKNS
jgi:hypothetical protein